MSFVADLLILGTAWAHVVVAPYTKVEESFNLHATHDVLMYGVSPDALDRYDHFTFPGAVPRTFIGSLLLGWATKLALLLAARTELVPVTSKLDVQIAARLVLATANALGLILVRHAVSRRFGRPTSLFFALLTCSQFHLPFWMGRTLPNMFALLPVNVAYYLLWNRASNATRPSPTSTSTALGLLVFTAVVFRGEVALLLAPMALYTLLAGYIGLLDLIGVGITWGFLSVALTTLVDSYFWDEWPLWPELYGIYFNVFQGKSADWGTSPPLTYFTAHLPKLLLGALPLSALGALADARARSVLFPCLAYVALLSALGHKEWRFITYVVPLFNVAAARGAWWLASRRKSNILGRFAFALALGTLAANTLITAASTRASMVNYPGGVALARFNEMYAGQEHVHIHICNLAAQTGASMFLHEHAPPYLPSSSSSPSDLSLSLSSFFFNEPNDNTPKEGWTYNKTESLTPALLASPSPSSSAVTHFTHLIVEDTPAPFVATGQWRVVEAVEGFARWTLDLPASIGDVRGGGGIDGMRKGIRGISPREVVRELAGWSPNRWMGVVRMERAERLWILERT